MFDNMSAIMCKLWNKFLIFLIILILIISYILIFYRNFELIFEVMALKRALICGRNVCLSFFFYVFLYLIVIILIEENKKNLTLCQNNEKWTKFLLNTYLNIYIDSGYLFFSVCKKQNQIWVRSFSWIYKIFYYMWRDLRKGTLESQRRFYRKRERIINELIRASDIL